VLFVGSRLSLTNVLYAIDELAKFLRRQHGIGECLWTRELNSSLEVSERAKKEDKQCCETIL